MDRTIIWNRRQLERLLTEYIEHYNTHRPHRALHQHAPNDTDTAVAIQPSQQVERHTTCGRLINQNRTAA